MYLHETTRGELDFVIFQIQAPSVLIQQARERYKQYAQCPQSLASHLCDACKERDIDICENALIDILLEGSD
jgi:hypothetical protein